VHKNIEELAKNFGGEKPSVEVFCIEPSKELYKFRGLMKYALDG
jgi:hypothetical protein